MLFDVDHLRKIPRGRNVHEMTQRPKPTIIAETGTDMRRLRTDLGLSQTQLATQFGYSSKTIYRWERGVGTPRRAVMECLRGLAYAVSEKPECSPSFNFVDLFAGIGGLRIGFESIGGKCVFTSEWDKYAQITYRANFGAQHPISGDIVKIPSDAIPAHDVLLAGFPCQPFSIAGVTKKNALGRPHGFACDTQGTLFFEVARILKHHRPRAFFLENVKNLASHDGGRTFKTIRRVLAGELGYHIFWKILDGRCVVPQHRERLYIVGFRDVDSFDWTNVQLPDPSEGPRLRTVLHAADRTEAAEPPYTDSSGRVSPRYYLSQHLWQYLKDYAEKHRKKGNGFGYGLFGPDDVARTLSARYFKDGSEILIKTPNSSPRRLTPRECSRLMGFDRIGAVPFQIPVSDTQAYRQFGNSVVVPVVEAVARAMRPLILGQLPSRDQFVLPFAAAG
jgi:DNA (cytosine-5)-methyltransferase 1